MTISTAPVITCFLLKIASRCNINCDYCYMYHHLDKSWKEQPALMSDITLAQTVERISAYVVEHAIKRFSLVYHGGEPLLLGTNKIINHAKSLTAAIPAGIEIEFSIQTNGTLLSEKDVIAFLDAGIQVSLSLDGPVHVNDRHRLDHKGKSTFEQTQNALLLLENYPDVFAGVIAVIDPKNEPADLFRYFSRYRIPQLDFLLPDANYLTLPVGRDAEPELYSEWIKSCFDEWFLHYPEMKVRTFDAILASLLGLPSETDAFGLGDLSLITIETDGTYHDLDVLKITGAGTTLMKGNVFSTPIAEALVSDQIKLHRKLLTKDGLSSKCNSCSVVDICGGGAIGHRFGVNGYDNPSIYCNELFQLIHHASARITQQLLNETAGLVTDIIEESHIKEFTQVTGASETLFLLINSFKASQVILFEKALEASQEGNNEVLRALTTDEFSSLAVQPSVVTWTEVTLKDYSGVPVHSIDGLPIPPDINYINSFHTFFRRSRNTPSVQRNDFWLRAPFGEKIYFESETEIEGYQPVLQEAFELINHWNPLFLDEICLISPEIQFIRDLSAHPDKIVSFSDNSVPGALYVQIKNNKGFIDPCDLADSIIHEHRHQRLYLLQRATKIVHSDFPLIKSPWREELRPPSGLFHAIYVFVELLKFWSYLSQNEKLGLHSRALKECRSITIKLEAGFNTIYSCPLTNKGRALMDLLHQQFLRSAVWN